MFTKVCSGLLGLGLVLGMTAAQQPQEAAPKQQKAPPPKPPTDELEAAIAAASANHPDVRLAQAKLQMAQAELDQAKLLVAQRLAAARAKVQAAKVQVEFEEQAYSRLSRLGAATSNADLVAAERSLAQAKVVLAAAEAEWQAARGQPAGHSATVKDVSMTATALAALMAAQTRDHQALNASLNASIARQMLVQRAAAPAPGSVADRIRELVGKRVRLDLKEPVPFDKAMEEFARQAGLTDLTVRYPEWANERILKKPPTVGPLVGEQTIAGWFQLILDDFNRSLVTGNYPSEYYKGPHEVYVRDYGLLITKTELAPPGAPTLAEFARQVRAEKDAAPKPDPKK
jgi:hypothetical protein